MKRRRREDEHGDDVMPAELEVCVVEDWTGPDEVVLEAWESDPMFAREHLAFRRWCTARRAWFEAHPMDYAERLERYPARGPRWRAQPWAVR